MQRSLCWHAHTTHLDKGDPSGFQYGGTDEHSLVAQKGLALTGMVREQRIGQLLKTPTRLAWWHAVPYLHVQQVP